MITPDAVLEAASSLGGRPDSLAGLISLLAADEPDPNQLAEVALSDTVLAAHLLRRANAADVGGRVQIADVLNAVMRLGSAQALSQMIAVSLKQSINRPLKRFGLGSEGLWRFSILASLAANDLHQMVPDRVGATAVTGALLQGLGKLALNELATPEQMNEIRALRAMQDLSLPEAELQVLGMDTATASGLVASAWGFPEALCTALAGQFEPDDLEDPVCDAIHVSGMIARSLGGERGIEGLAVELQPAALERLGLAPVDLFGAIARVGQAIDDASLGLGT